MTGRQRKVGTVVGIAVVAGVVAVIVIPGGSPGGAESGGPASSSSAHSLVAGAPARTSTGSAPAHRPLAGDCHDVAGIRIVGFRIVGFRGFVRGGARSRRPG